ncbi:MAG: hypothetical protein GX298_06980 [Planctomycetes bacterium]|nr:hypothetical protein [Planctomycetota bacterium]
MEKRNQQMDIRNFLSCFALSQQFFFKNKLAAKTNKNINIDTDFFFCRHQTWGLSWTAFIKINAEAESLRDNN